MKVLLKIGYNSFLLPNDSGLTSVVKVLSKAVQCTDHSYRREDPAVVVDPEPLEISFKFVPEKQIRCMKADPVQEPLALPHPSSIIIPQ